jgi:hypothetical protein
MEYENNMKIWIIYKGTNWERRRWHIASEIAWMLKDTWLLSFTGRMEPSGLSRLLNSLEKNWGYREQNIRTHCE